MIPTFQSNSRAVIYIRVSTGHQAVSGLGLTAQRANCVREAKQLGLKLVQDHYEDRLTKPSEGVFVEAGESAYKTALAKRPAGERLLKTLQRGDTLIISRIDRAFRSVRDFIVQTAELTEMGVRLVVCSPKIDLATAFGRSLATLLATLAEWESARKGERIRNALRAKANRAATGPKAKSENIESLPSDWRPSTPLASDSPEQIPGKVYVYIRCSHRSSAESGLGLLAQARHAEEFAQQLTVTNPLLTEGGVIVDSAISAAGMPFKMRPGGRELDGQLTAGDHVVFSSLDRGFRSINDMATMLPEWDTRGVHVHFVEEGISMDDPEGRMMAHVAVLFASYEAEIIADRNREARAQLASRGKYCGGGAPTFWKVFKVGKTKRLVIDRKRIVVYRLVTMLRRSGLTLEAACKRAEDLLAKREGRRPIPMTGIDRFKGGDLRELKARNPDKYTFVIDKKLNILPCLNRQGWLHWSKRYEEANAAWAKRAAELRKLKEQSEVEPVPRSKPNARGWTPEEKVYARNSNYPPPKGTALENRANEAG